MTRTLLLLALLSPLACSSDAEPAPDQAAADVQADTSAQDTGPVPRPQDVQPRVEDDGAIWLVAHDLWRPVVDPTADPFADHRPDIVDCPENAGYSVFETSFEIDTDFCNYMTVWQPTLTPIKPGSLVRIDFWHLDLVLGDNDPEGSVAHIAVAIGGELLWEKTIPIPIQSNTFDELIPVGTLHPKGTPITFHAHNHGPNSYRILRLTVEPPKPIR